MVFKELPSTRVVWNSLWDLMSLAYSLLGVQALFDEGSLLREQVLLFLGVLGVPPAVFSVKDLCDQEIEVNRALRVL